MSLHRIIPFMSHAYGTTSPILVNSEWKSTEKVGKSSGMNAHIYRKQEGGMPLINPLLCGHKVWAISYCR